MRLSSSDLAREPFRIFFPAGIVAGIIGVSLWPLYFGGVTTFYPGLGHARIMAYGLFGAFIFGFLGTAMPRMLSAKPLRKIEVFPFVIVHALMVVAFAFGKIFEGDALFLLLLIGFVLAMGARARERKDTPPPGFVLVGLAFLCVGTGAILALLQERFEVDAFWIAFQRLLSSQGFILLPILGIGPFILPRFFGMQSTHDFPESQVPASGWWKKAFIALAAGILIIASFFSEARGWFRTAYGLRFATTLMYLILELPLRRGPDAASVFGAAIRMAFAGILAGFLAVCVFPAYRVGLLHLTLVGGFAVITFIVATRVIFGHSGNIQLLQGRNRWLYVSIGLMLFGMATRISGDFWPRILATHYIYGALIWIAGVLLWAVYVLPKVLIADDEG